MEMVIEHKHHTLEVKTGTAIDYVACVPCKGTGQRLQTIGGDLWVLGWQLYQDFGCPYCGRRGVWKAH